MSATNLVTLNTRSYMGMTPDPANATRDAMRLAKDGALPIAEIFYSIQGEGVCAGEAMVFVRLAGCNCDCWFCDTDFRPQDTLSSRQMIERVRSIAPTCRTVCLTGGEPTIHDLGGLCRELREDGYRLHMETNGTRPCPDWPIDHITVSPKTRQGARLDEWYLDAASEFKHVVDDQEDVANAVCLAGKHDKPVSLQPNSCNPEAEQICVDAVKANPGRLRLSIQTHKIMQIR